MGNTDSTQKLGERVLVAKRKLQQNEEAQSRRYNYLKSNAPAILSAAIESVKASFTNCSPFLEPTLLLAWMHDSNACKNIILKSCSKVLSAPIQKSEYAWFKEYVFESSVWFFKTSDDKYMYEELLNVAKYMSKDIINSMDSIYTHLESHRKWNQVMDIKDISIVPRQDYPKVGLFQNKGFKDVFESKTDDEQSEEMKTFVDSNLAVNILTSTATNINQEFQNYVKAVMSHYGQFQAGPTKKVERCVSKLENDYQKAAYPKSAKLLDLVRCSITFNTVDQLMAGYNALTKHISKHTNVIELARVKNGFTNKAHSGYRDIKLNVIYRSEINPGLNMICEIQLLLINYLQEKKRIHKLYSIVREEVYFQMVTTAKPENEQKTKDIKDLEFIPALKVKDDVKLNEYKGQFFKCSMHSETDLLGLEGSNWFGCVDINERKMIFEQKTGVSRKHSHTFFSRNDQQYLSLQTSDNTITIFEINEGFEEEPSLRIMLGDKDVINYTEFDRNFDNIFMVYNESVLQKRSVDNISEVVTNIKLDQKISLWGVDEKMMVISNDGKLCAIGAGYQKRYFYLADIPNNKQHKLISDWSINTVAPSFVNGQTEYIAICGHSKLEIWNIEKQSVFKQLPITGAGYIMSSVSANNILGIGCSDYLLRLFDVRTWEMFHSRKFGVDPYSLHLTNDLSYLTVGGRGGEKCVVLKIQ